MRCALRTSSSLRWQQGAYFRACRRVIICFRACVVVSLQSTDVRRHAPAGLARRNAQPPGGVRLSKHLCSTQESVIGFAPTYKLNNNKSLDGREFSADAACAEAGGPPPYGAKRIPAWTDRCGRGGSVMWGDSQRDLGAQLC